MPTDATTWETILYTFGLAFWLLFAIWPILVLAPLQWRKPYLNNMLLHWGVLAVMRLLAIFSPATPLLKLIPEPLNTLLFLAAGAVLLSVKLGQRWRQRRRIQSVGDGAGAPSDLLRLSPRQFEEMVVAYYRARGHKAKRTGAVGDHGVDVVVQAKNGEKWVAQCKRWRSAVGESIVRDFYGVMQHEKADRGAIITAGRFSRPAREWARGKPLYLCDGAEFVKRWKHARAEMEQDVSAQPVDREPVEGQAENGTAYIPLCPTCRVPMVLRTARRGPYAGQKFYGCANYPACREIVPVAEEQRAEIS